MSIPSMLKQGSQPSPFHHPRQEHVAIRCVIRKNGGPKNESFLLRTIRHLRKSANHTLPKGDANQAVSDIIHLSG
jgi:hypothetical protein